MKELRDKLEERIAELLSHTRSYPKDSPFPREPYGDNSAGVSERNRTIPISPPIEDGSLDEAFIQAGIWRDDICTDAAKLAEHVAAEIHRYADSLIPNQSLRRALFADDEIVTQWPLATGTTEFLLFGDRRDLAWTLQALSDVVGLQMWHPKVTFEQAAELLERLPEDPFASSLAALIKTGSFPTYIPHSAEHVGTGFGIAPNLPPNLPPSAFALECTSWDDVSLRDLVKEAMGNPNLVLSDETGSPKASAELKPTFAFVRLARRWSPSAVSVLAYVERKVAQQRFPVAVARIAHDRLIHYASDEKTLANVATDVLSLDDSREGGLALLIDEQTAGRLAALLRAHATELVDKLSAPPSGASVGDIETRDGILAWDATFAAYIEARGEHGKVLASQVREAAAKRMVDYSPADSPADAKAWFRLWTDDPPRFVRTLARVLWHDVLAEQIRRESKSRAALVVPVMHEVTDFHSRGRVFDTNNGQLTFAGREIASIVRRDGGIAQVDLDVLERGLGLLGSKVSHDVLRHEVFEAHRRVLRRETFPNVLAIEGGWSGFAELLGYSPKKYAADIKNIVYAQAHFRFTFPDGSHGNMLSYNERDARGRHGQARVTLTLGSPLLPGYVHELRERMGKAGLLAMQAQRLVPMPRYLPPFYGRANEHGQQASMALALMTALREHAAELAEHGSVCLTHDDLTALADRASLPRRLLVPVIEHWQRDVGDTPAFIKSAGKDRYTLAEAHAAELAFIVEAGERENKNRKLGQVSARMRASDAPRRRKKASP